MNKIDLDALISFLQSLRANSYSAVSPDGSSRNRFDSTTVSFSKDDKFICYTTVADGVLYSFYSDLILYKEGESGTAEVDDPADFTLINEKLRRETAELEDGLILRSDDAW